jgi:hypothetical protein
VLEKRVDQLRVLPSYSWDVISGRGGASLAQALRDLCTRLGYNPDELPTTEEEEKKEDEKKERKKARGTYI